MKKILPFVTLLVLLISWTHSGQLYEWFNARMGDRLSAKITQALSSGDIEQANRLLKRFPDHWTLIKEDGFYHKSLLPALTAVLGDSLLDVTDTIEAKMFIAAVENWPWPLQKLSINRMSLYLQTRFDKQEWHKMGFNHVFDNNRKAKSEHIILESQSWRREQWINGLNYISFISLGLLAFTHFAGIGIILIMVILFQRRMAARDRTLTQPYARLTLTPSNLWVALAMYVFWIILYIGIGVLLQWIIFKQVPYLTKTAIPGLSTWFYACGAILSFTLFLFLIISIMIRKCYHGMSKRNHIDIEPKISILWFTILAQYKYILWRLWPGWIFITGYLILLFRN